MNELIQITTDEQGLTVVQSARELHSFLEVKSKFADWFKNRVSKWGFVEGQDYTTVSKNLEIGGRELDYALTLDMAKELSMVERNAKGKAARQYFIEAEKRLREVAKAEPAVLLSPEQVLLQQAHQIVEQGSLIAQLRADVDKLLKGQRPQTSARHSLRPTPQLFGPPKKNNSLSTLRQLVHGRVNEYCGFHSVSQSETYSYLYKRLFDVYTINVYRLNRASGESILDAVERYGHLDKMYGLITAELTYVEE